MEKGKEKTGKEEKEEKTEKVKVTQEKERVKASRVRAGPATRLDIGPKTAPRRKPISTPSGKESSRTTTGRRTASKPKTTGP